MSCALRTQGRNTRTKLAILITRRMHRIRRMSSTPAQTSLSSCGLRLSAWCIPDRRTPCSLLDHRRIGIGQLGLGFERIVGAPAAGGVFQNSRIIESPIGRGEIWIAPGRTEFSRTLVFRVAAIAQAHLGSIVGAAMSG